MTTFETVLMMLLVADAIALAALILLQQGRGADVGAAFGSGSSNTMFGSGGGASFITKLTAWLAIGFFVISFGLAYFAKERAGFEGGTSLPDILAPLESSAPAAGDDIPVLESIDDSIPSLDEEADAAGDSDIPDL